MNLCEIVTYLGLEVVSLWDYHYTVYMCPVALLGELDLEVSISRLPLKDADSYHLGRKWG